VTVATGNSNVFAPVDVLMAPGQTVDFENLEAAPHNLISRLAGPDGGPLFEAKTFVGPDVTKAVEGVQYLSAGTYDFHCSLHENMIGTLKVTGSGTPVARPKITVAIKDSKLDAVRKSGVLKTKIKNSTTDGVVELEATLGDTTLADQGRIAVAGGDSQNVSLKLSRAGKKALKGLDKAKVKLEGTPAFGKPASVKKTLK
jgi:plastocyanin